MSAKRRRFQFSLRKPLLWTVVVVPYLAVVRVERWDVASFAVVTTWLVAVGTARVAFGSEVAGSLSALAGAILGAWLGYMAAGPMSLPNPWGVVFGGTMFSMLGCILFGVVEAAVLAVNWADRLLAGPTSEDSGAGPRGLPRRSRAPDDEEGS